MDQIGESFQQNVLVIHDFGIFPKFRSKGIGERAMKGLIEHYSGKCGFIVLKSFPKQFEGDFTKSLLSTRTPFVVNNQYLELKIK